MRLALRERSTFFTRRRKRTTESPGGGASVIYEPPKPSKKVRITQYAAAFPIAPDLAVTSAAAIGDNATLQVQFSDGQSAKASLVRKDETVGLALIKIEGKNKKLIPLVLADSFAGGTIACVTFPTADLFTPTSQKIPGNATPPRNPNLLRAELYAERSKHYELSVSVAWFVRRSARARWHSTTELLDSAGERLHR